jgi:peptidoglycan L-alanyl-D-glutamate endopeptidase CwlK
MPVFSKKSQSILSKAHEDLQDLFNLVIERFDCTIICSVRSAEDQQKAFDSGHSKAKPGQSPHNFEPSFAVDVVPASVLGGEVRRGKKTYKLDWNSRDPQIQQLVREEFFLMAGHVKAAIAELGLSIQWGGDFKSFEDLPHWEISDWETKKN